VSIPINWLWYRKFVLIQCLWSKWWKWSKCEISKIKNLHKGIFFEGSEPGEVEPRRTFAFPQIIAIDLNRAKTCSSKSLQFENNLSFIFINNNINILLIKVWESGQRRVDNCKHREERSRSGATAGSNDQKESEAEPFKEKKTKTHEKRLEEQGEKRVKECNESSLVITLLELET